MTVDIEKTSSFTSKHEQQEIEEVSSSGSKAAKFTYSDEEKRLVKKMNLAFIPFVCLILFIQFLDKTTLSIAAVMPKFSSDTHITNNQYSWVGSMFYLGYLCMQLPNSYMLQKLPIGKYVGVILLIWGACLLSTAFAKSFGQLLGLRFLLGFFEAVTYPSMFLLIATMYRRSEQVIWLGVMFISNGVATVLGSLIGVGIMQMPTVAGISAWQWSFIIFGIITSVMGIVYFFFLPDRADSIWYRLTKEEMLIVKERTRDNAVVRSFEINYAQIYEALREPRFYCYCLIAMFLCFQNGAFTVFTNIIIAELGFTSMNAVLLSIPTGIICIILIFIATNISKRKNEIIWVAIAMTVVSMAGLIILAAVPFGGVKLLGLYLSWGGTACYVLLQASIASNVSGYTKKIFYTSGNMVFYTFGNFIGPLLLREQDAPRYIMGMGVYVVANALVIILFAYIRYSYVQANKRRHLDRDSNECALPDEVEDITDKENPHFVYHT